MIIVAVKKCFFNVYMYNTTKSNHSYQLKTFALLERIRKQAGVCMSVCL